jgi:hypothetical protein
MSLPPKCPSFAAAPSAERLFTSSPTSNGMVECSVAAIAIPP